VFSLPKRVGLAAFCAAAAAALGLAGGCTQNAATQDGQEETSPVMRRARARVQDGDIDSAIRLYKAALEDNERLARAHLDLALLLNDQRKDYLRAIYHYQRYLELRPAAEKKEMIEDRIRLAGQQYAATIIRPEKRDADKAALEKENAELKEAVKGLKQDVLRLQQSASAAEAETGAVAAAGEAAATAAVAGAPATNGAPIARSGRATAMGATTPAGANGASSTRLRTYRVKKGDTLMGIAGEVYGDNSKWKKIQDANRKVLGGASSVKVGQILVIP